MQRKPNKKIPFPYPFRERDYVKVSQPGNFSGFHLGVVTRMCPKNDGGIMVYLTGANIITKEVCVLKERGDTIQKITLSSDVDNV